MQTWTCWSSWTASAWTSCRAGPTRSNARRPFARFGSFSPPPPSYGQTGMHLTFTLASRTGVYPSWGSDGIAAEMRYAFGVIRHVLQKRGVPDAMPDGQHTSG